MARMYAALMYNDNDEEPKERIFRTRQDAFCLYDDTFISTFRLSKTLVRDLCEELRPRLSHKSSASTALSVETLVLCTLRFLGTGSYLGAVGRDLHIAISQPSVSRAVKKVTETINELMLRREITFPLPNEYPRIKLKFREYSGFPGVIGAIDCTHVPIIAPPVPAEENYVNRKGVHSINVQLIVDSDRRILNINAKHPGRTHDAFIWRYCELRRILQDEHSSDDLGNSWLLGDSGYALEPWLMTPILHTVNNSEVRYNRAHVAGRNVIERTNGVYKSRFRCIHKHRTLNFLPTAASRIINTCAILHNLCIKYNELDAVETDSEDDSDDSDSDTDDFDNHEIISSTAKSVRDALIKNHFS